MKRPAIYKGRDSKTPPTACLGCGKLLDMAMGIGNRRKPRPGMMSICIDCGHVQVFDWELKFRPLTDKEMIAIAGDPIVIAAQKARAATLSLLLLKKQHLAQTDSNADRTTPTTESGDRKDVPGH